MSHTVANILISGAGQLGSRHLQGLAKCHLPLRIYVQDIYKESLSRAEQRWNEVLGPETHHDVSFHTSFESIPRQLDIAIVATTAEVRPKMVGEIANLVTVRFWVLEKVLAQNESGLDEIVSHTRNSMGAWVNTPRRMMPWHQKIKAQIGLKGPLQMEVRGGAWGLACNSVHFLDLFAWWTGGEIQEVVTDRLNPNWAESKRKGFWEVLGTLEARFSGGSQIQLGATESKDSISITVSNRNLAWKISEPDGLAIRSDGIEIHGRVVYQSEMSGTLVASILEGGYCDLPTLEESVALHRVFIRSMLEHWKQVGNHAATSVPIT